MYLRCVIQIQVQGTNIVESISNSTVYWEEKTAVSDFHDILIIYVFINLHINKYTLTYYRMHTYVHTVQYNLRIRNTLIPFFSCRMSNYPPNLLQSQHCSDRLHSILHTYHTVHTALINKKKERKKEGVSE